ncbi:MAG TPA: VWA domain-containing protein [Gaiellaceae bacterium]|nr:VWA domain-containing protein [Gaiellaceae bacterium]
MSFSAPALLVLLVLVPLAALAYALHEMRRDQRAAAWATPALLPNMLSRPPAWRRHLPFALLLIGLALLLVGFARPKTKHTVKDNQATLVVVMDVSGSMAADDARPNRLAQAKAVALRLTHTLPKGYRMAVVTFSDHSDVVAPPSNDLNRVRAAIDAAKTGPQGTALGQAVFHAVQVARTVPEDKSSHKKPPALIVVVSDGGVTAGRVSPQQAASRAANARVPVYTILVGSPNGVVHQPLKGGFTEQIEVPAQPVALQYLSRTTGGRYAASPAAFDPHKVFASLGSRAGSRRATIEVTAAAAGGGLAFMVLGVGLSGLWFRRLL